MKTSLVAASKSHFVGKAVPPARQLAGILNAEPFHNLRLSEQPPVWSTEPRDLGKKLPDRGGVEGAGIFLPLYLNVVTEKGMAHPPYLPAPNEPTLFKDKEGYRFAGAPLLEFEALQKKCVALGIVQKEDDVKPAVNLRDEKTDAHFVNAGIEVRHVNLDRLLELRDHTAQAIKTAKLIKHVFGLDQADWEIVAPQQRSERLTIKFSGISPAEFAEIVKDTRFAQWFDEPLAAQPRIYTDIGRGFPRIFASLGFDAPLSEQAEIVFDGEDKDLYRKILKLSVLKDFLLLSDTSRPAAKDLLTTLQKIADGVEAPKQAVPMLTCAPQPP